MDHRGSMAKQILSPEVERLRGGAVYEGHAGYAAQDIDSDLAPQVLPASIRRRSRYGGGFDLDQQVGQR